MNGFFFVFEKMSSLIPMFLLMLHAHAGKCSNSCSQMFCKTGVGKNFAIFTAKILCWSLFLIKFQDWRPKFLSKRRLQRRCFSVNIKRFLRTAFLLKTYSLYLYFYLMIENGYFRVRFYYCKIKPRNRKEFAIDRSKLVFLYLIISLLQRFVSPEAVAQTVLLKKCS